MGAEFGQFIEWDEKRELDWFLLKYPMHLKLHSFFKALNAFYLKNPSLWRQDFTWRGFEWILNDDNRSNVVAFLRKDGGENDLIAVCNFSPVVREEYRIGVPENGSYEEVFNSDLEEFGGRGHVNAGKLFPQAIPWQGRPYSLPLTLPPLGVLFLRLIPETDDLLRSPLPDSK
jgi:1,4-alpha-glucan branching enzyme